MANGVQDSQCTPVSVAWTSRLSGEELVRVEKIWSVNENENERLTNFTLRHILK
jgi:hypothetical protein